MRAVTEIALSFLLPTACFVLANDAQNYFITKTHGYPHGNGSDRWDSNPVRTLGSIWKIEWRTSNSAYSLNLWQQYPNFGAAQNTPIMTKSAGDIERGELDWNVTTYDMDLDFSSVFYFGIDASPGVNFNTAYFNISRAAAVNSSSTSSSSGVSTSSPTKPTKPTTPTPTPRNLEALKVGLGVGLGFGIPLLLTLGILAAFMRRRRRQRLDNNNTVRLDQKQFEGKPELSTETQWHELPVERGKSELSSGKEAHEVLGDHTYPVHELQAYRELERADQR